MRIRASVLDLSSYAPKPSDKFVVDTNVWLPLAYARIRQGQAKNIRVADASYEAFVKQALTNGALLYWAPSSFCEIANCIERTERDLYSAAEKTKIGQKTYRHERNTERVKVVLAIKTAWRIVTGMATGLPLNLDDKAMTDLAADFNLRRVDAYDQFLVTAMQQANILNILTNDADFASVTGICIVTSNSVAIAEAQAAGKLATDLIG